MTAIRFVTLTPAQRASHNRKASAWVDTLRALACDDSDPETRDNARAMLARRGL